MQKEKQQEKPYFIVVGIHKKRKRYVLEEADSFAEAEEKLKSWKWSIIKSPFGTYTVGMRKGTQKYIPLSYELTTYQEAEKKRKKLRWDILTPEGEQIRQ